MTKNKLLKIILISLIAFVILFSAGSMIFIAKTYRSNFPRYEEKKYSGYLKYSDVKENYGRTAIQFPSGGNTLKGYVYGEANDKGLVVIAPGRGTSQEEYLPETLFFVDKGWRVLTFDIRAVLKARVRVQKGFLKRELICWLP